MTPAELRSMREKLGMSQAMLAKALGFTTEAVNRWENGRNPVPKLFDQIDWTRHQQANAVPTRYAYTDRHGRLRTKRLPRRRKPMAMAPLASDPGYEAWLQEQWRANGYVPDSVRNSPEYQAQQDQLHDHFESKPRSCPCDQCKLLREAARSR